MRPATAVTAAIVVGIIVFMAPTRSPQPSATGTLTITPQCHFLPTGPWVCTFTATQSGSPPLIVIRWDFNGDGVWGQTPTAVGCPATCWSTDFIATKVYQGNLPRLACAEAWDAVSFKWVDGNQVPDTFFTCVPVMFGPPIGIGPPYRNMGAGPGWGSVIVPPTSLAPAETDI